MTLLTPQPWMTSPAVTRLFQAIPDSSAKLRFVGGCVRDALMGMTVEDVDLTTPYHPDMIMGFLQEANIAVLPIGLSHGTVMAIIDGTGYEITTLRRDVQTDGRRATVAYTDQWHEDAARRDFTFNALYLSIDGTLFDPWGGVQDLRQGVVRFIGKAEQRIQEDYLRILRYFRFYARFAQQPADEATLYALKCHSPGLEQISGERIQHEMTKILGHPNAFASLKLMESVGVLQFILNHSSLSPDYNKLNGLELRHSLPPHPLRSIFALQSGQEAALEWIKSRWKVSNKHWSYLKTLYHTRPQNLALHEVLYRHGPDLGLSIVLLKAIDQDIDDASLENQIKQIRNWKAPIFPLTGQDLMALGLQPGPKLGQKMQELEQQWINSHFTLSKEVLLRRVSVS